MTDFKNAKRALTTAIGVWQRAQAATLWASAAVPQATRAWQAVEDAILALDNAAYDRAFNLTGAGEYLRGMHAECDELQRQFDERGRERDRLVRELELAEERWETEANQADQILKERDEARRDATTMTLANDDKRQELRQLKAERDRLHQQWARCIEEGSARRRERDDARAEIERLRQEVGLPTSATLVGNPIRKNIRYLTRRAQNLLRARNAARAELTDARGTIRELADQVVRLEEEFADARGLLEERDHLQAELSGFRGELELLHEHTSKEIERLRTESVKLIGALGRIEVMSRNSLNDDDLLPALKRVQAEAWEAYRNAQEVVLPIGEPFDDSEGDCDRLRTTLAQETSEAELADARNTIKVLQAGMHAAGYRAGTISRLRKALETLADRYHAKFCVRKPSHTRQECEQKTYGVQQAEKALAGESKTTLRVHTYGKEGTGRTTFSRWVVGDRKPKEQPEIEAVLMGSRELQCADGCGRVMKQAGTAYRHVRYEPAHRPLYASKECARKAGRDRIYQEPATPTITDIDILRACRGFHERGDFAPFVTLAGDFSATVITAKMQAMVARGLLMYDTSLSTAWATMTGRLVLQAVDADEKEQRP